MRAVSMTVVLSAALGVACSGGDGDGDTDTDVGTTDATADDTDEATSDKDDDKDDEDETDVAEDTDVEAPLAGTPVELVNPGFESHPIAAGGDLYQGGDAAPSLEISGWDWYIGTAAGGVGVSRPDSARFGQGEPLAAPAEGNVCGYLDARRHQVSEVGTSQLSSNLTQTVSEGQIVRARLAFAHRVDSASVSGHASVVLGVAFDDTSVASVNVEVPSDGTWVDATVEYTVPLGYDGSVPRIYASATQSSFESTYYQTYIDNLRVTVE